MAEYELADETVSVEKIVPERTDKSGAMTLEPPEYYACRFTGATGRLWPRVRGYGETERGAIVHLLRARQDLAQRL
jgi:hypothetical protein